MSANPPKVAVLMGSKNDWSIMQAACEQLDALGIANEARVISAHRTPQRHHDFVTAQAPAEGVKVFICGAGMAAHLAGVTAALSSSPVIGVPLESGGLGGMDSLLSTVQMPGGMPVATVAVGKAGAKNAAILAAQMLGLAYPEIAQAVTDLRCQLPCRGEHQRSNRARFTDLGGGKMVENRKCKRSCFPCSCLSNAKDILSVEQSRYGLGLDGGWFSVSL